MFPARDVPPDPRSAVHEVERYLEAHPDTDDTPCLCGASRDVQVVERDRDGLRCPLWLCCECGLIRMNPQPSERTLAWFYAHHYRAIYGPHIGDPTALFASMEWKGRLVESALRGAALELRSGPIVDLGCGGGWVLERLRGLGWPTLGYDYDEPLLALGRARGLDLRCGGVREARDQGVRAELLVLAHVLEHTKDPVAHLRSLHPLVAPGGWLYLEVPHTRRIGDALLGQASLYWQRAHLWDFQRPHLDAVARRAGWVPVYASDDRLSVQLICQAGAPAPELPMPRIGSKVAAQLRAHERLRRSFRARACVVAHRAVRWAAGRRRALRLRPFP